MGNFCSCSESGAQRQQNEIKRVFYEEKNDSKPWGYPYDMTAWKEHCPTSPGFQQSPINLPESMDKLSISFKFQLNYGTDCISYLKNGTPENMINNGNTIRMNMTYKHTLSIVDTADVYDLVQFHFHTTSEHTVNNRSYPLELHLVHTRQGAGDLLVLGIFFDYNDVDETANGFLASFWNHLPGPGCGTCDHDIKVNLSDLASAISSSSFYNYHGSLTTPPLSEGVKWIVVKQPLNCSKEQVVCFQKRLGHTANFRPPQAIGDRVIHRAEIVKA